MLETTANPSDPQIYSMFPMFAGSRVDEVHRAGVPLVAEGGWLAVTPRSVAETLGCSRQCVHQWFGSQQALRQRFAERLAWRYGDWIRARIRADGPVGMLPDSPLVASWVRCWWSMRDAASRDADLSRLCEAERGLELDALSHALGQPPVEVVGPLHAMIEGCQPLLCTADGPELDLVARARESIRACMAHLGHAEPSPDASLTRRVVTRLTHGNGGQDSGIVIGEATP